MGSPKGMHAQGFSLVSGDQVHVSSSPQQIFSATSALS